MGRPSKGPTPELCRRRLGDASSSRNVSSESDPSSKSHVVSNINFHKEKGKDKLRHVLGNGIAARPVAVILVQVGFISNLYEIKRNARSFDG